MSYNCKVYITQFVQFVNTRLNAAKIITAWQLSYDNYIMSHNIKQQNHATNRMK